VKPLSLGALGLDAPVAQQQPGSFTGPAKDHIVQRLGAIASLDVAIDEASSTVRIIFRHPIAMNMNVQRPLGMQLGEKGFERDAVAVPARVEPSNTQVGRRQVNGASIRTQMPGAQ